MRPDPRPWKRATTVSANCCGRLVKRGRSMAPGTRSTRPPSPPQSFGDQRTDAGDALDIGAARFNLDERLQRVKQRLLALRESPDRVIRLRRGAEWRQCQ